MVWKAVNDVKFQPSSTYSDVENKEAAKEIWDWLKNIKD